MTLTSNTSGSSGELHAAIINALRNSGFVVLEYKPTDPLAPFTVTGSLAKAAIAIDEIVALYMGARTSSVTPSHPPSPQLWHDCWANGRLELAYKSTALTIAYESYLDYCERHKFQAASLTKFNGMLGNKVSIRRMWQEKKLQTFIVVPDPSTTPSAQTEQHGQVQA